MKKNNTEKTNKLIAKALSFKQNGDLINAEIILKDVLKLDSNNFIALNNIGNIYSAQNELKKAKIFFSKAINIKHNYSNAIFNLALVNEEMGNKEEAIKFYKDAIKYDQDNLGIYYNLSRIDDGFFLDNNIKKIKEILKKKILQILVNLQVFLF